MRQRSLMLVGACVLTAVAARDVSAQTIADTTTVAFRPGEWGAGFILRNNVTSAGLLRFNTPTHAWVLDGSASFDRGSQSSSTSGDQTERSYNLAAQLGPRWYHAMSGHVARYLGLGVSGGYARSEFAPTESHVSNWSIGGYGEAGMQYLITRYLGLGWRGTINASRVETNSSQLTPQGFLVSANAVGYHVGLDAVQLTGTIYF
jgi:hypothetical protein